MPIAFPCPGCRKTIKAKESLAGRKLACPGCGHALTVPEADTESASTGRANSAVTISAPATPPSEVKKPRVAPTVTQPTAVPLVAAAKPEPQRREPQTIPLDDLISESKPKEFADVTPWNDEETEFKLQPLPEAPPAPLPLDNPYVNPQAVVNKPKVLPPAAVAPLKPSLAFRAAASNPVWQRRMLLVFVLALIPLALHIAFSEGSNSRPPIDDQEVVEVELSEDAVSTAFLAHDSKMHWVLAAVVAVLFMGLLCAMAMDGSTQPWQLLAISGFTATGGVVLLLLFQYLAVWSATTSIHGRGIIGLLFLIVKLIGYSYHAALDPENGFIPSMLGFTFGVGLCEEFCKAMPLFAYFRNEARVTWRGAMLWGLASGVGFGIAEGIMYSGDFYNGHAGAGIYFVRFFSCVALHAIWTAAVAITLYRRQAEWQYSEEMYEHAFIVLKIIAIPMVLHGLYDTLLKQEYAGYALLTAVASFGYLGWLNYHCEKHE